jgi:hypothetical protein
MNEDSQAEQRTCAYSAAHMWAGVPATQVINCGPVVGDVACCDECAALYERLSRR